MAQNVTIAGASYSDVPSINVPKTGGGTAVFADPSVVTAAASDVASGKYFIDASGALVEGTASGGGGGSFDSGSMTLASTTKSITIQLTRTPSHFCFFAPNETFPTDNAWKTSGFYIPELGGAAFVTQAYGPGNRSGALRAASYISFNSTTKELTFSTNYNLAAVTYYWCAW